MSKAVVRSVAISEKACGNFDFEGHFAVTALSMGIEVLDHSDIPAFRSWVDHLLRFLRLA